MGSTTSSTSTSTSSGGATTSSFLVTLVIDLVVGGILFLLFCVFRRLNTFRWIYQPRLDPARRKSAAVPAPPTAPQSFFGWIPHTYQVDSEVLLRTSGMDNTMYTMWFASMFKLMCWILVPAMSVLIPINMTGENGMGGFDALSMSNIGQNSVRLWAHLIIFYYIVIVTCYWLYRSYRLWLNLRIDYLKQAMFKGGAMTVAFTDLPKVYRSDQAFYDFAYDLFGDHVHSTYVPRDLRKLNHAIMERADVINQLEQAISKQRKRGEKQKLKSDKYERTQSHNSTINKRDTHDNDTVSSTSSNDHTVIDTTEPLKNNSNTLQRRHSSQLQQQLHTDELPLPQLHTDDPDKPTLDNNDALPPLMQYKWYGWKHGFKKVDIIKYYTDRLNTLNETITNEQINAINQPAQSVGLVTLRSALMASMCSRTPGSVDPFSLHIRPAPEPEDIDWNNLKIDDEYRTARQFIITITVLAGVIFYCVPVTFFTGLTSISGLQKILPGVAAAAQSNIVLNGLITGFLPSLGYILFMALLPLVLNIASRAEGRPSRSSIQIGVFEKYFLYQYVNFFIFTIFSGAVFTTFTELVNNPGNAPSLFGQSVPTVATQFINYIVTRNFLMQPLKLLAYDDLLLNSIGALFAATERQKQRTLNNITNPSFGSDFPINICIWIIAVTYASIAPILLPFAAVFFSFGYIIAKYQALYMNVAKYETGGLYWPLCFNRMVAGLIVAELAMIGIFGVKQAAAQSVLVVPLLIGTLIYWYYVNSTFSQWQGLLPIEAALQIDRARIDNKQLVLNSDDVRDYSSIKGVSPYRQPELLAPRNLQPFYSDPIIVLQAAISEGAYNDLGEGPRADVPSRLELLHENKLTAEHDTVLDCASINGTPTNIKGTKRYSAIHTEHYEYNNMDTPTNDTPQPTVDTTTNNDTDHSNTNNHTNVPEITLKIPILPDRKPSHSVFNESKQINTDKKTPVSNQHILNMQRNQHQGQDTSNATDIAASIDVQKSIPDKEKYTQTKIQNSEDLNNTTSNAEEPRSNISKALDAA